MNSPRGSRDEDVVVQAGKLVGGGRALAHAEDRTWLIAGALPGERVAAREDSRRAGVVEATAVELLGPPHPARVADPCRHAPACGGCDWPHVDPEIGARLKAEAAAEAVRGSRVLADALRAAPIRTSPPAYRLRSRLHWDPEMGTLGLYESRSWRVTPIPDCRIISARLSSAVERLERALAARASAPVDLEWLEDLGGDHAVAALRPSRSGPARLDPGWLPDAGELDGVVDGLHVLSRSGASVIGWGKDGVVMALPVDLFVPIGSFFQGNRHLAGWLFDRVADLSGARPCPTWDLHAGVGFLAAAAWHAAPRTLSLAEPSRRSALAARRNLPRAEVAVGITAEASIAQARNLPTDALVLTDPPRAGMSPELRHRLAGWSPDRILMLACDPATWGRDTSYLLERGYRLTHLELVDLFPSTHHVEILAVLEPG